MVWQQVTLPAKLRVSEPKHDALNTWVGWDIRLPPWINNHILHHHSRLRDWFCRNLRLHRAPRLSKNFQDVFDMFGADCKLVDRITLQVGQLNCGDFPPSLTVAFIDWSSVTL